MALLIENRSGYCELTLDRPAALNALDSKLVGQIADALEAIDHDPELRAVVIAGSDKAFAAGADVSEIHAQAYPQSYSDDFLNGFDRIARARKPRIAAVESYALGGGCELAMLCDVVIAGEHAVFGQPEILLHLMPGAGGTQRLWRRIGAARAAEWCLSGRKVPAIEAHGLVSRVVPAGEALSQAQTLAGQIARRPLVGVLALTEALRAAEDLPLTQGLRLERRLFQSLLGTDGAQSGTAAFLQKNAG